MIAQLEQENALYATNNKKEILKPFLPALAQ
jgi:hypothetical protein